MFPLSASAQESATLEEIISGQEKWLAQFATIRVRWREWHRVDVMEYHPTVPRDATLENSPVYSIEEFCWSDVGMMSHENLNHKDGKLDFHNIYGMNGKVGWDSDGDPNTDFSTWQHVKILQLDSSNPLKSNLTINGIYGLWSSSGDWWTTRIRSGLDSPTLLSPEMIGEHECAVVLLRWAGTDEEGEVRYWFDPSLEFLPRKMETRNTGKRGSYSFSYVRTWTVDRFEEVSPGFHFPMHGYFHLDKIPLPGFEWLMESVELNPSLPADQFEPHFSPGCRVTDYPGGRAYIADATGLKTEPDPPASIPIQNSGSQAIAVPPSINWSKISVFCGLILAALLTIRWLRTGRKSPCL